MKKGNGGMDPEKKSSPVPPARPVLQFRGDPARGVSDILSCPVCGSGKRKRDGVVRGVQRWQCKGCGLYYQGGYRRPPVSEQERVIAARLLAYAVAPLVIASALEVSGQWIYQLRRELRSRYGDDLVGIIGEGRGVK